MQVVNSKALIFSLALIVYASAIMWMLLDVKIDQLSLKRRAGGFFFFLFLVGSNIFVQSFWGMEVYAKYYFVFAQLPVYVFFRIVSEYKHIKLFFVLLTAVIAASPIMILLTISRHYFDVPFGLFLGPYIIMGALVFKFLKKPFNYMLKHATNGIFMLFIMLQFLYYIYTYLPTEYQFSGITVDKLYLIRQIPLLIVLISYILLVLIFNMLSEKNDLNHTQSIMALQLNAATEKIEQFMVSQSQMAIYHHDLRHHLNYIKACIAQDKPTDAIQYINETYEKTDGLFTKEYSKNQSVNLILSAYVMKAEERGIYTDIEVTANDFSKFLISDLCSLIANALENAILACEKMDDHERRYIKCDIYEKNNKLCFNIQNSYDIEPIFEYGIPVSRANGHGFGTKSMVYVVEKYKGIFRFATKDKVFVFQVTM